MIHTPKISKVAWLFTLLLLTPLARGQSLNDAYEFTTGVNASLWEDMTGATTLNLSRDDRAYTSLIPIGFNFNLAGTTYQNWTVNTNGCIRLGDIPVGTSYYTKPFSEANASQNLPKIVVLGCDGYIEPDEGYVKYKLFGTTEATRKLVIEYRNSTFTAASRNYPVTVQVQLKESDRSITYVFGEVPEVLPAVNYQMGVASGVNDIVLFNTTNHTADFLTEAPPISVYNPSGTWPEQNRYYKLTYNPNLCFFPGEITLENIDTTHATVRWDVLDANDNYSVCVDSSPCQIVNGDHLDLTGLAPGASHSVTVRRICSSTDSSRTKTAFFHTTNIPANGCIDPTNFNSGYITAYYGTFNNPYANTGIINSGPNSSASRHTIHTNVNEKDPRTGSRLSTVPPGGASSVRLGNWQTNYEAEAILYVMKVDTTVSDLLILQYAAVLQDPNHSPEDQPRFRLEILNSNMQLIDPVCGAADFIANSNLGWNTYGTNLWKDWTTVGIDLSPYAGQIISIRLTTYDCDQGAHYGYAYFSLSCGRKNMQSESCGDNTDNTFTVPAGFNYLWYTDTPSSPISTSQSLNVSTNTNTIYHCLLSFIDKPQCNFTMSVLAGVRYPLSIFDTTMVVNNCQFDVSFTNRSTISADGVTPSGTGEGCETAWWDFGNGDTSSFYHASTHYDHPGTYTVTLVSTIANGLCADTLQRTIDILPPGPNPTIIGPTERCLGDPIPDTLYIQNAAWSSLGNDTMIVTPTQTTTYTVSATDDANCTYSLEHTIAIHPTYSRRDTAVICTPELPFTYGSLVIATASDTGSYSYKELTIHGCDSTGTVFLTVNDTSSTDTMATACESFTWHGTTYTTEGSVATRVTPNIFGCDSTTTLHLTLHQSSDTTLHDTIIENQLPYIFNDVSFSSDAFDTAIIIPNSFGCDSNITYTLFVHWNVDTTLYDTLCNDQLPYVWNGIAFDTTVNQTVTMTRSLVLLNRYGADSTITMNLTIHPLYDHHLSVAICDNQQYTFGDSTFLGGNGSIVHLDSLRSQHGCDSLSTLHLTVHPTFDHHTYDTICSNQSIVFTNTTYNTTGDYPHTLQSQHQCDSLSTLHLQVWPAYDIHTYDTLCDDSSRFFIDTTYRLTGNYTHHFHTSFSCDSLHTLHLKIYPTYDIHLFDTIYEGDTYLFEATLYDTTGIYPHLLSATFGCDSLRTLHLQRNRRTYVDSVVCQNHLPMTWNGLLFADGNGSRSGNLQTLKDSVHLSGLDGIDSLVVMTVTAKDTSASVDIIHSCDSLLWNDGILYISSTSKPSIVLQNQLGCDSIRHLNLTLNHTHHFTEHISACDSMLWIDGQWYYRDTAGHAGPVGSRHAIGPVDTLVTRSGCDSVVSLDLQVHYATYEESLDTFCYNQTYHWRDFSLHGDSLHTTVDHYLTDTLRTIDGCDSVLAIRLTQMAQPAISFYFEHDCDQLSYRLTGTTNVPYITWSSVPYDSLLDGHEHDAHLTVSPHSVTDYLLYVDYYETPFCPYTETLTLRPITIPKAVLEVNPEALKYNAMDYNAYDASLPYEDRTWYVDWMQQDETSRHLSGQGSPENDSIVIALRVYNGQCYDTAVYILPVLKVLVLAPNVFTPSLDINNRFTIATQGVIDGELFIYNREGLLVFRTKDFNQQGWDGAGCVQGNYVWRLDYHAVDHPEMLKSTVGSILLLR